MIRRDKIKKPKCVHVFKPSKVKKHKISGYLARQTYFTSDNELFHEYDITEDVSAINTQKVVCLRCGFSYSNIIGYETVKGKKSYESLLDGDRYYFFNKKGEKLDLVDGKIVPVEDD